MVMLLQTPAENFQVSLDKPKPHVLEHLPTPMARTVFGKEIMFRLQGHRLAYVPWEEMIDRLKADAPRHVSRLRDVPVVALPFGVRREVELIRALSVRPQVLMLDEPVSGLEDEEAQTLVELLLELQAKEGWGLLVIEHALEFITSIAEQLIVMEDGRVLVQGPIHEVMREEQVRRVYLGEMGTV